MEQVGEAYVLRPHAEFATLPRAGAGLSHNAGLGNRTIKASGRPTGARAGLPRRTKLRLGLIRYGCAGSARVPPWAGHGERLR
jgi:hypothetical protein